MSQKVRKTLIMIVMAALIICLMAASLTYTFTYGRYAGGKFDEESPYDDLIEFVGANQYLVYSPEELIQAIKDGYSNIQIADEAEQPFVITEGVTDVTANLVLDVNGKTLIRNSRNPMLDVQTNVSVVLVYDSSDEGQGGFYNPVGSALQASGGTLTIGSGNYDDGPKGTYSTSDISDTTSATLVTRTDRTETSYGTPTKNVTGLPKIDKNHYFAEDYDTSTGSFNSTYIKPDTFLILTYEDDCELDASDNLITGVQTEGDGTTITAEGKALTVPCNVASCDFYYYYEVGDNPTTSGEKETNTYAVIYGYWDVMALAEGQYDASTEEYKSFYNSADLVWPYAAVRMEEGEGFARGGQFSNHFDAVNTYGIYAEGGTLTASGANFTTGGNGVCIRVQSAMGEATTTGETTTTGGSLTISGGEFSSEKGNTIEMSGGNMTVTAGTFTKSAARSDGNDQIANQTAIIDIQGGTLKIEGNSADSVKLTAEGTVTDNGGTDNGGTLENVFGIRAEGGTVTTSGCTFNISGDYSAGVLSYNGEINLGDDTSITVTQSETATVLTSAGVSSEQASGDGEHPVNLSGDVTITSNGLGITARGAVNVTEGESTVTTTRGTGIYVNNGSFTVDSGAAITVNSTVKSDYSWATPPGNTATNTPNIYNGVYVQGGSLESEGTLNVNFTGVAADQGETTSFPTEEKPKSYAVYVDKGAGNSASATVAGGTINAGQAGGVYVEGGSVALGGSSTVTINTGAWTDTGETQTISSLQGTYASAVYAHGGTVTMNGTITINSAAIGIVATAADTGTGTGAVTIKSGTTTITAYRSTGVYIRGGSLENSGTLTVDSKITNSTGGTASTAEDAYKWAGADIEGDTENENIYNGVYVKGGSLISNGTLNVNFTGVKNDDTTDPNAYLNQLTRSYAVRVEAGESANTTVTILSGEIINSVGGGVLANGGRVTLGKEGDTTGYSESNPTGLTVQTTGKEVGSNISGPNDAWGTWDYRANISGGDAVKVDNGTLYVNGGKFTADQGNGILVRSGNAYVYNGYFSGKDSAEGFNTGYGAAYAFKLYGGNLSIFGGEFRSEGGGAFIMGTAESEGTAKIYGGIIEAKGASAVSVWQYADVLFDNEVDSTQEAPIDDVPENYADTRDLYVAGASTGVAMEGNTNTGFSVKVSGSGMFTGGSYTKDGKVDVTGKGNSRNGIWYGNGNATLNISGGTLQGETTSGLWFEANPGNNVQLSGGEYRGNGSAWGGNELGSIQTRDLLVTNNDNGTQTFGWLYDLSGNAIIYAYRDTMLGDYNNDRSHVGGTQRSVVLNGDLIVTGVGLIESYSPLSDYHYIKVQSGNASNNLPNYNVRDYGENWATRISP